VVGAAATVLASCLDVGVGAVGLLGAGFALVGLLAGIDWASGRIPNQLVLPGLAAAVAIIAIATPAVGSLSLLVGAATGVLVVAGPLTLAALVSDRQAVGGGDVKLAALVGMLTGVVDVLAAETALAVVLAGWVLLALSSRARGRRMFVLGPVLAFAGLVGLAVAALLSAQGVDVKLKNLVALVLSGRT
jgi:leader peptidase (prepilin peptidase)/N-methyltransferase